MVPDNHEMGAGSRSHQIPPAPQVGVALVNIQGSVRCPVVIVGDFGTECCRMPMRSLERHLYIGGLSDAERRKIDDAYTKP